METVTVSKFIRDNKIKFTADHADSNPGMVDSANMDHWKCLLSRPGKRMTVYFSMGYGHRGSAPKAADVLDCLGTDASTIENADCFETWASEYGYGMDSRKAEKIFKNCEHQAKRLCAFLGEELYHQLLWNTERE
jgi:hypothetical protein